MRLIDCIARLHKLFCWLHSNPKCQINFETKEPFIAGHSDMFIEPPVFAAALFKYYATFSWLGKYKILWICSSFK